MLSKSSRHLVVLLWGVTERKRMSVRHILAEASAADQMFANVYGIATKEMIVDPAA